MVTASSYGCRAGGVSLELEQWKPGCSCSQGVPSFCKGAGVGLNDGRRMGGGRDGWWLTCRQRRSLLCVSEAYKAASVCDGTERQGTVAQSQCGRLPSQARIIFFRCPSPPYSRCRPSLPVSAQLRARSAQRIQQPSVWRCNLV